MFLNIVLVSAPFCAWCAFCQTQTGTAWRLHVFQQTSTQLGNVQEVGGESASTKTLLLRMPHAWAPCSQWHTGFPFSSSVACFKTPVQCHECAKCRCQYFLLHLRKERNASAMDIMSVIAFRSKDMFIFTVFLARSLPWIQKVLHEQIQFTMEKRSKMIEYAARCSRGT